MPSSSPDRPTCRPRSTRRGARPATGSRRSEVSYEGFSGAESGGLPSIQGLGEEAWLDPYAPADDPYLTVILYTDPNGLGASVLYVEMAGHDGVDYTDQTIAVAHAVIDQLQ